MLEGFSKRADGGAATARIGDDQHALLALILTHGQSYDDLSDFLGCSRSEVRAVAHDALARLDGGVLAGGVAVSDYLLGQADSSECAAAVRHLRRNPDDLFRTEAVALKLRLMLPGASVPELPRPPRAFDVGAAGPVPLDADMPTADRDADPRVSKAGAAVDRFEAALETLLAAAAAAPHAALRGLQAARRNAGRAVPRFAETSSWRLRLGLAFTALVLLAALLSELVLPSMFERRLRGQLEQVASVERVDVGAFPAVKTLFGGPDRVELELGELDTEKLSGRNPDSDRAALLDRLGGTDAMEVSIDAVSAGPARLEDVELVKAGDELDARFLVKPDEVAKALPLAPGLKAEVTAEGGALQVLLSGGPFGDEPIKMNVGAEDGQLVGLLELDGDAAEKLGVAPGMEPPPQPLFQNEQIEFKSVAAKPSGDGLIVTAKAQLKVGDGEEPAFSAAPPGAGAPATPPAPSAPASPAEPEGAPPGGSGGAAPGGLPPELVDCLADEGVRLPKGGGLPAGVSPAEIQRAVQACAQHLPQGAVP